MNLVGICDQFLILVYIELQEAGCAIVVIPGDIKAVNATVLRCEGEVLDFPMDRLIVGITCRYG